MLGTRVVYLAVVACLGALSSFPAVGWAQEPPPAAPEPVEVVVTGSRTEERIDRAASLVEVIRRADIEQSGARDAAELLEERPGLQVVRSFRGSELQLRGLDPAYTLILVDGDRVPGQIDGAIDLSRYGVENIERIEIVRGPGSALYGADAIGGVINILTRESKREFEASGQAGYGQRNQVDVSGNVAGRPHERLRLQLTAELHRSDAYHRPGEQATTVSAREQWATGARIYFQADARNALILRGAYMRANLEGVDTGAGDALFDRTQLQEQPSLGFEHRLKVSSKFKLVSRIKYSQFREQYLLDQRRGTALDRYEDNREHMTQLTTIGSIEESGAHRTTVGFEEFFQSLDSARLSRSGQRARFAGFAQHAWLVYQHGESELEIVPGFRFDLDTQFGSAPSPKIALRYKAASFLEFRGSYGHGFRAPTFQEQLLRFENPSVGYIIYGNPNVGAENSDGFDASARLFNDVFECNVTFFRNDLRNMITTVLLPMTPGSMLMEYRYDNIEYAWTTGVESSVLYRLRDEINVTAAYTWTDTWDDENKRHLLGRAPHRITGNAHFLMPAWELDFTARAALSIGRIYYEGDDTRGTVAKPLAQVDARIAKHFGRALELYVGIDNLFNAGDRYTALRPFTVYGGARGRY